MKITLAVSDLQAALDPVVRAVEKNTTIPILGNLLLTATDSGIALKGSDLDLEIESKIACSVTTSGVVTVPAHLLLAIVKKLSPDAEVTLESKDTGISVRCGRSRFSLPTLEPSDFPTFDALPPTHQFSLTGAQISDLFETTAFAISTEETRFYLNGVHLVSVPAVNGSVPKLRGVATDGHRLAMVECDGPDGSNDILGPDGKAGIIVPRKMVSLLTKTLNGQASVDVAISRNRISFDLGNTRLTSKLIDGSFPDYERVIPKSNDKIVMLDRKALTDAVERVAMVSSAKGRGMKLSAEPGLLTLSVADPEGGTATEDVDADYTAEPMDIGFNSSYLGDILGELKTDRIQIKLATAGDPTLIQGTPDADASSDTTERFFVLMPMRV